ncbi:MAG: 30S ribosome-binding factor RbfA [Chlorobi bacterium]|nr:30S ribosome-binding factor RbfA [Chlorobiota bacterium]MCI0716521.1 30S ribosome-binding factor RbfA [Chlorobiota bacterium]
MSIRTEKVAEEIRHRISDVLSKDLAELHLGLVTVTKVRISSDLKNAKIYLSFIGNKETVDVCLNKINARKKQIRMHLSSKIYLRNVPEISFYFDDAAEYSSRIDELIKQIHKDDDTDGK